MSAASFEQFQNRYARLGALLGVTTMVAGYESYITNLVSALQRPIQLHQVLALLSMMLEQLAASQERREYWQQLGLAVQNGELQLASLQDVVRQTALSQGRLDVSDDAVLTLQF